MSVDISETVAALSNGRDDFDAKVYAKGESLYNYVQRMEPTMTSEEPVIQESTPSATKSEIAPLSDPPIDMDVLLASLTALSSSQRDTICKKLGCSTKKEHRMRCVVEILVALACVVLVVVIARRSRTA